MNPDLDALPVAFIDKAFKAQLALLQLAPQLTVLFWSENGIGRLLWALSGSGLFCRNSPSNLDTLLPCTR